MAQAPIRVLIADDMIPIREYLSMVLSHEPDMAIVDAVGTGAAAVERALALRPDVVLMDLEMEAPRAGVDAIKKLARQAPELRSVVLTHFGDDDTVFAAFEAGASDYVLKNSSAAEILEAVRAAAKDMSPLRPQIARMIRAEFRALRSERAALVDTLNIVYRLTPTEVSILRLLAEGKDKNQIARIQCVEASTVRTHIGNILKKFDENAVKDIVRRLQRLGIFEIFTTPKSGGGR
ncbi:NarL family two-component system response regulator LiaR [Hydrogenispora ethanolica]|jgi:DNA-binding NarL/FixJ family response regulator|uniref:NarL family two-component system response regulator LiaR n=1 Tax=Hydrogenispora ethanolica TaxID=1082276 RepID=A0A4V6NGK3_HYDET|nr:response regulator transcription factor [Hydrogenispora ethanolica]TCL54952.1 NarL family two-component system response regulator LiaR [Hydrogenispora ethanolica]